MIYRLVLPLCSLELFFASYLQLLSYSLLCIFLWYISKNMYLLRSQDIWSFCLYSCDELTYFLVCCTKKQNLVEKQKWNNRNSSVCCTNNFLVWMLIHIIELQKLKSIWLGSTWYFELYGLFWHILVTGTWNCFIGIYIYQFFWISCLQLLM